MSLTRLQLLAPKEHRRPGEPPAQTGIAAVLGITRDGIAERSEPRAASASLPRRLAGATTDAYQRHGKKKSRSYPRRKEDPSTGAPIITPATQDHQTGLLLPEGFNMAA